MESPYLKENENSIDLKKAFFKYFFYWKYFVGCLIFFLSIAFVYVKYTTKIYETTAKIKILDKKESALEMPTADNLFSSSKINLENEIELISSYSILEKVVQNLNLNNTVTAIGNIKKSLVVDYPFVFKSKIKSDSITNMKFRLDLDEKGLRVTDYQNNEKEYLFKKFNTINVKHNLPFNIYNIDKKGWVDEGYYLNFHSTFNVVSKLKKDITVFPVGKSSDIIVLKYNFENIKYAQNVLNEILDVFNNDGVKDRQLLHKRTIDFVNERYVYLSQELDSIEIDKQIFKQKNNLVDLRANSAISLEKSTVSEGLIFSNKNQIFITNSLIEDLMQLNFELLPSNIGISNLEINALINSYNEKILDHNKLLQSAGINHPMVVQAKNLINDSRSNIIFSLQNYLKQLNNINNKQIEVSKNLDSQLTRVPENEKILRSIERNQEMKEALYLFLLQKREEAEVSYAVTEPSIKVVEYALSSGIPLTPKTKIIYLTAIILGLMLPFFIFYLMFLLNTKIQTRGDIEETNFRGNILAEIPNFDLDEDSKVFSDPSDRSVISESFRMLMSNTRYLLNSDKESNVVLVTSSIKGEGKTLSALNLSLAFATLGKKVLLVGCDLRNPQLHKHINEEKDQKGLVNFLVNNKLKWKEWTLKKFEKIQTHDILLCGSIPPNPLNLISNGNLEMLINDAKELYDYIIIDTAPTLLVADTQNIFKLADAVVYLTRCNITDKSILQHIEKTTEENKCNFGIVLNGIGEKNAYGYSYGYKYGYGYNYKYSYNYGYGYGYNEDKF